MRPVDPFIGSLTRQVWQWVRQRLYAEMVVEGYDDLTPAQFALFRNPSIDGARPGALADDMQITKQSVNELLGHLERRGYLVREADPADNRSRRIRLTARGRELEAAVFAAAARAEQEAAELIGADRMRDLRQTLFDLVALLDEEPRPRG